MRRRAARTSTASSATCTRRFEAASTPSMRQVHRAGEKLFVDYSGKKPASSIRETGEVIEVELFVAVLGACNYTYAEATLHAARLATSSRARRPRARVLRRRPGRSLVPDQLRSAVIGPDRYEPEIKRRTRSWRSTTATAILPARPAKPRDKAKVEVGVLIAQRWILARLRQPRPSSASTSSTSAIAELLEELNARPFQKLDGCQPRELFERLDRPALKPLPASAFGSSARWKDAKVNIDYHVELDDRLYSVPHALVGERGRGAAHRVDGRDRSTSGRARRLAPAQLRARRAAQHRSTSTSPEVAPRATASGRRRASSAWAATIGPRRRRSSRRSSPSAAPGAGLPLVPGLIRTAKRYGTERASRPPARRALRDRRARRARASSRSSSSGLDRVPTRRRGGDPTPTHRRPREHARRRLLRLKEETA